ncbi:hypothetical protein E1189_08900 [Sansalvadorimonas verongulae]|nr:hypothetical protein [Sansalvadorimonas verongulae]
MFVLKGVKNRLKNSIVVCQINLQTVRRHAHSLLFTFQRSNHYGKTRFIRLLLVPFKVLISRTIKRWRSLGRNFGEIENKDALFHGCTSVL